MPRYLSLLAVPVIGLTFNLGAEIGTMAPAVRGPAVQVTPTEPPPAVVFSGEAQDGHCVGAEPLLAKYSPGWSVSRMSAIMYRESNCQPTVRNRSGATGLLQIMTSNCGYLTEQMGESCNAAKLQDPVYNIRAARELYEYDGYGPWAL